MTTNDLLAACDLDHVGGPRGRYAVLDALLDMERLEEWDLVNRADLAVWWDEQRSLLLGLLDEYHPSRHQCPTCGFFPITRPVEWCPHVVVAGLHATNAGQQRPFPDRSSPVVYRFPTPQSVAVDPLLDLVVMSGCSPVLPHQPPAPEHADTVNADRAVWRSVTQFYDPGSAEPMEVIDPPQEGIPALDQAEYFYVVAPDPAAYVQRLVNLIRQRVAAGCPIP